MSSVYGLGRTLISDLEKSFVPFYSIQYPYCEKYCICHHAFSMISALHAYLIVWLEDIHCVSHDFYFDLYASRALC